MIFNKWSKLLLRIDSFNWWLLRVEPNCRWKYFTFTMVIFAFVRVTHRSPESIQPILKFSFVWLARTATTNCGELWTSERCVDRCFIAVFFGNHPGNGVLDKHTSKIREACGRDREANVCVANWTRKILLAFFSLRIERGGRFLNLEQPPTRNECANELLTRTTLLLIKQLQGATTGAVSFAFHEPVTFPLSSPSEPFSLFNWRAVSPTGAVLYDSF